MYKRQDDNGNQKGSQVLKGDVNNDGEIDSTDYIAIQKYIMDPLNTTINAANADLNGDSKINTIDSFALRKMIMSE